jgi:hypothetical protein
MRLVDGKEAELAALVQRIQQRQKARRGQALGGGVEQGELAAQHLLFHLLRVFQRQAGVEEGGGHAGFDQGAHLVVHQGDQGRHHHGKALASALAHDGWHLVAQRFATARGHEHQRVAARAHVRDDVGLRAAEGVVAEHLVQHVQAALQNLAAGGDVDGFGHADTSGAASFTSAPRAGRQTASR